MDIANDFQMDWRGVGRRLVACNPFYLISAPVILLGVALAMRDTTYMSEAEQLSFNLMALLLYETLLVGTALVLVRRQAWYDATLLVMLDQLFLFVPSILLSLAAFETPLLHGVWAAVIVVYAVARLLAVKRLYPRLNLPGRLLLLSLPLMILALILPLAFRHLHLGGIAGTERQAALLQGLWLLLLPAVAALANLLRRPTRWPSQAPELAWLPLATYMLWIFATGAHVWWVGFVYDLPWRLLWLVPTWWVLAWTLYNRRQDLQEGRLDQRLQTLMLLAPAGVILGGYWRGLDLAFVLMNAVNAVAYGWLWHRYGKRLAGWLAFASLIGMVASWPLPAMPEVLSVGNQTDRILGAIALALILLAVLIRRPLAGLGGALAVLSGVHHLTLSLPWGEHAAVQCGAVFLLLHSLTWPRRGNHHYRGGMDNAGRAERLVRVLVAGVWIADSFVWGLDQSRPYMWVTMGLATALVGAWLLARRIEGPGVVRSPLTAGAAVLMLIPGQVSYEIISKGGIGIALMVASLIFFGAGTLLAWNRSGSSTDGGDGQTPPPALPPAEPDPEPETPDSPAVASGPARAFVAQPFTLKELILVLVVLFFMIALLPMCTNHRSREDARKINCAGNLKQIGLGLLMYSGDNGGHFPTFTSPDSNNFEPMNTMDVLDDGKVYACPSAAESLTLAANSNYAYRGSGLVEQMAGMSEITVAYDTSGNHPDNKWMNALFTDGHVEGARPDGQKSGAWNLQPR